MPACLDAQPRLSRSAARKQRTLRRGDCCACRAQRRGTLAAGLAGLLAIQQPAQAWDGPAKLLKARQQAGASKLLAPVDVGLSRLQAAEALVERAGSGAAAAMYQDALQLVRKSSCNCYAFEASSDDSLETRVSLITANLNLADPCTYRIIAKSTTVLLPDGDPTRAKAFRSLAELIRTYERLDDCLLQAGELDSETVHDVKPLLRQAIAETERFRAAIATCIAQPA